MRALLLVTFAVVAACGAEPSDRPANGMTAPTRVTHAAFPIGAGSRHQAASCEDCHGTGESFHELACASCHSHAAEITDAQHAALGVQGYVHRSSSCFACHGDLSEEP